MEDLSEVMHRLETIDRKLDLAAERAMTRDQQMQSHHERNIQALDRIVDSMDRIEERGERSREQAVQQVIAQVKTNGGKSEQNRLVLFLAGAVVLASLGSEALKLLAGWLGLKG